MFYFTKYLSTVILHWYSIDIFCQESFDEVCLSLYNMQIEGLRVFVQPQKPVYCFCLKKVGMFCQTNN